MAELASEDLKIPLILVVGHTGCYAIAQGMNGTVAGSTDRLRAQIETAYTNARANNPEDLYYETVCENVRESIKRLKDESWSLRKALESGSTSLAGAVYDLETGEVKLLDFMLDEEPTQEPEE